MLALSVIIESITASSAVGDGQQRRQGNTTTHSTHTTDDGGDVRLMIDGDGGATASDNYDSKKVLTLLER